MLKHLTFFADYVRRRVREKASASEIDFLESIRKGFIDFFNESLSERNKQSEARRYRTCLRLFGVDEHLIRQLEAYSTQFIERLFRNGYFFDSPRKFNKLTLMYADHVYEIKTSIKALRDFEFWFGKFQSGGSEQETETAARIAMMIEAENPLLQTPNLFRKSHEYSDGELYQIIEGRLVGTQFFIL